MKSVRIGLLGVAHAHAGAYCARWRERPDLGALVTAAWDRDASRLAGFCKANSLEAAASPESLLARSDVDAVLVAAETAFHAELVEQAAAAGRPIALQKPLCLTMAEADRIVSVVGRAGVPFTLAWQMRVDPHNLKVKSLLQDGSFGRLYMLRRRHCLPTQQWKDFDKTWHVKPELNRDIFADDAAHAIDFIYWLLGMPESVTAEMATALNPAVKNDNAIALYRYPGGTLAEVSCTFVAVAGENVTEAVCERGTIIQNYGDVPSCSPQWPPGAIQLKWFMAGDKAWTPSGLPDIRLHGERIAGLAGPLAAFLRGERPPIATAQEGRDVLAMTLGCYDSMEQGRRIRLAKPA